MLDMTTEEAVARLREALAIQDQTGAYPAPLRPAIVSVLSALEQAQEDAALLREAAEACLDPDPCSYDHHGNCQAHGGGDPCEQKLLRAALASTVGEAWLARLRAAEAVCEAAKPLGRIGQFQSANEYQYATLADCKAVAAALAAWERAKGGPS